MSAQTDIAELRVKVELIQSDVTEIKSSLKDMSDLDKCVGITNSKMDEMERQFGMLADTLNRYVSVWEDRFSKVDTVMSTKGWDYVKNISLVLSLLGAVLAMMKAFKVF